MEKADLSSCLQDPSYRPLGPKNREEAGLPPHHAYYNSTHNRLVVILKRGSGGDYSTNTDMLKSVCNLQKSERLTQAYLVQVDGDQVIAWETVFNVSKKVNGVTPHDGKFGPFVWLEERTFKVVGGSSSWPDDELPF